MDNLHDQAKSNRWNSVCIVIEELDDTFIGYIPFTKQEVSGSSINEVKEKAKALISNVEILPRRSSTVITFLELA
jgi:hypothetical protein